MHALRSSLGVMALLWALVTVNPVLAAGGSCTSDQIDRVTTEARGELMAICCWKNTLLNHSSPRADQLSDEVRRLAEQCYSTQEVLDHFTATYGESILARPRAEGMGLWFYVGPAVLLLITGVWLAMRVLPGLTQSAADATSERRPPPSPTSPTAASEELDRLFERELRERST